MERNRECGAMHIPWSPDLCSFHTATVCHEVLSIDITQEMVIKYTTLTSTLRSQREINRTPTSLDGPTLAALFLSQSACPPEKALDSSRIDTTQLVSQLLHLHFEREQKAAGTISDEQREESS